MRSITIAGGAVALAFLISSPRRTTPVTAASTVALPTAVLRTSAGDIVVLLREDAAPLGVDRFLENARRGVYDDTVFHDTSPQLMVFGGCFAADGSVKRTPVAAGNQAECENGLRHERARVGFRGVRHRRSDGAVTVVPSHEIYVCLADCPAWDGQQTLFGEVLSGMDILDELAANTEPGGRPRQTVRIERVEIYR